VNEAGRPPLRIAQFGHQAGDSFQAELRGLELVPESV
jgi:hypothetical protein